MMCKHNKINYSLGVLFVILLTGGFCVASSWADSHNHSPILPTVQTQDPLEVLWKERRGRIILDSVCFNYPTGSDEYRGCRKLAKKKFGEECLRFKQLYYDSKPYYDKEYEHQKEKYCDADLDFVP